MAIETSRGLLVATLREGPRKIYAVNPMAASRYRDRHGVSRKKSDPGFVQRHQPVAERLRMALGARPVCPPGPH